MLGILEDAFGYFATRNHLSMAHRCSVGSEVTVKRSGRKVTSNGARFHHQQLDTSSAAPNHIEVVDRKKCEETAEVGSL